MREQAALSKEETEETMLKLVAVVCLLSVAGLVMVGGCTPEENKTWSESQDFGDYLVQDWSGPYSVTSNLDGRFTSITIYQSGTSLQGFDNMRRSWFGHLTASDVPQVNLETSDGPSGTEVVVGTAGLIPTLIAGVYQMAITGEHWATPKTGVIDMLGPLISIAE